MEERGSALIPEYLCTRPNHMTNKAGESGTRVTCLTNYIPVKTSLPQWKVYQYHVTFDPEMVAKDVRCQLLKQHEDVLGKEFIFDGMILYLPFELAAAYMDLVSLNPRIHPNVRISIKPTKQLTSDDPQCITLFNLIIRKGFEFLNWKQFGRNFYDPDGYTAIPQYKIEVWPGIVSAIRFYEQSLLMCCELTHRVMRTDNVLEFMQELYRSTPKDAFKQRCTDILVSVSVITRYNNKIYKVDDVAWDKRPSDKFSMANGEEITFKEYCKKQYGRVIKNDEQPLLLSRAKNRGEDRDVHLVPELCAMSGLTDEMRNDRRIMQALATHMRLSPTMRIQHSLDYLKELEKCAPMVELLDKWNLQLDEDVASANCRVLPIEKLTMGDNATFHYSAVTGDWSRELRNHKLADPKSLNSWLLVFSTRDRHKAQQLISTMQDIGSKVAMSVNEPQIAELGVDRVNNYVDAIRDYLQKCETAQLIVALVPNDNKTRYDAIKRLCCLEMPIASQVVRSPSLDRNTLAVTAKILLQINCKMGGSLWRVDMRVRDAMMIGYNLYKDSGSQGQCVGAAVSSTNPELTRWFSQCALHSSQQELTNNLADFCLKAVQKYCDLNGRLPGRVFLFRDGCGDGQIPVVFDKEVPLVLRAMEKAAQMAAELKDLPADLKVPRLSFVVVTKRTNVRFFVHHPTTGNLGNPPTHTVLDNSPPGTVLDTLVTRPERYDFYLVPQGVRQGSVTPVAYNVLWDESGLSADRMQWLAYKLCHLYFNWQGTVRLPAPAQYDFYLVPQGVRQGSVTPVAYNVLWDESGLSADRMQWLAYKLCHLYFNWQGTVRLPAPVQYAYKLAFLTAQSLHAPAHASTPSTPGGGGGLHLGSV